MKEYYFDCGAGIESQCEAFKHEGQKACAKCSAAITYFNELEEEKEVEKEE